MTAFSLPRETSLHRNRDASLLSAIPSLRSLRISFPAPSSQQSGFRKRQSFSDCLFAFLLVSPPSRKVLRFFGSVADELLFGSIPDDPLFVFLILLYYLLFIFTKKMTAFSLPRETSLHRNRDASLLTYLVSRSVVATKRLSQETIFFRLSLCFFACCSSFPKSSALLRERSGRSAFREHSRQTPFQGIFLLYQQLLPKITSFPLVSSLFFRTVIRFPSAFASLPKSNRLKIKTRLLPRFLRAFTYNIFFMSSSRLTMPSIASCVCLRVSPYTSSCTRPTR